MQWIVLLAIVQEGASLDGYSHAQLRFLAGRKPWTVLENDGQVKEVQVKTEGILKLGNRLIFKTTRAVDENDPNPVIIEESIYAVPHDGKVYWLREQEMAEFTSLSKNAMHQTMSVLILLLLIALFLWTMRRRPDH